MVIQGVETARGGEEVGFRVVIYAPSKKSCPRFDRGPENILVPPLVCPATFVAPQPHVQPDSILVFDTRVKGKVVLPGLVCMYEYTAKERHWEESLG